MEGSKALQEGDVEEATELIWESNAEYQDCADMLDEIKPPKHLRRFHRLTKSAVDKFEAGTALIATGLERDNVDMIQQGIETYGEGDAEIMEATDELKRVRRRYF